MTITLAGIQQTIPTPRTDADDVTWGIRLGGVQAYYRLRWVRRASRWYIQWHAADGETLVSDWHAVSPMARITHDRTAPGHPPGLIECIGQGDGATRDSLWDDLRLVYVVPDE